MAHMRDWLSAFRLRTLPLASAGIGMGSFLAYSYGQFRWEILGLSFLTAILLQILSNLANDYGDAVSGIDGLQRQGPKRTVQSGKISKSAMLKAIVLFGGLSLGSGLLLLYIAFFTSPKEASLSHFLFFLGVGVLSILAAITYTVGRKPYGYAGLGDISVLLFFGLVGVGGTFFLHTLSFDWKIVFPALACGLFAVAVLNVNNIRDIDSDRQAGKKSIPVRLGRNKAVLYHWILLISGFLLALLYTALTFEKVTQFIFILIVPLLIRNALAVQHKQTALELDPYLKQMALTTLAFVITFGLGIII